MALSEEVTSLGNRYLHRHSATVKEAEAVLREYEEAYRRLSENRADLARDHIARFLYQDYRAKLMVHIEGLRPFDTLRINLSGADLRILMAAIDATLSAVYSYRHSYSRYSVRLVQRVFDQTLETLISSLEHSKKAVDAWSLEMRPDEQTRTFCGMDAFSIQGTIRNILRDDLKYLHGDVHASIKANLSKIAPTGEAALNEMLTRFYHSE